MKKDVSISKKEIAAFDLLERVSRKELSLKSAASILQISYRQCKRLFKRFKSEGQNGLIHRARGRASNRAFDQQTRQSIIARYQQHYPDFGPTFAAEKLLLDGFTLDHETLRRWLINQDLWQRRRKRDPHRSWRQRRAHFGELAQMDGSHHQWFEDRGDACCLMNMVDDATGVTLCLLSQQETIQAAMTLLWKWIESFGIPSALYTDGKNVYIPSQKATLQAELEGREELTHFGKACKRLAIRIIHAHSPQAKGRVERSNSTYQDRLVKELRLAQISDIDSANEFLYSGFLEELNAKFGIEPRQEEDFHRKASKYDLGSVFCIEEGRHVSRDWIVRFENNYYQLKKQSRYSPQASRVLVRRYLNGELHFNYRGEEAEYELMEQRPKATEKKRRALKSKRKYVPSPDHPWQKSWKKKRQ